MANQHHTFNHVAIFPSPGMGHLIPLVELAKLLVRHHDLQVTFLIPSLSPPSTAQKSIFHSLPPSVSHVFLPQTDTTDLSLQNAKVETLITQTVARSLTPLREELERIIATGSKLVAVVADLFSVDCFELVKELGAAPYLFFASSAMTLSTFLYMPKLDEMVQCEYKELEHPIEIPGCMSIWGGELFDPALDRKNEAYKRILNLSKIYKLASGIMVNTFMELENGPIKTMQDSRSGYPPVFAVGPMVKMEGEEDDGTGCLKWLSGQPKGSVLFVSFGSAGTLTSEQITELAMGLEMSEQRFLWVVRCPSDSGPNSAYFSQDQERDPFHNLPNGFLDRTKSRGLTVNSWVPQAKILSHGSTGGFLSHCGWNSTLESLVNGVPMIAWPLHAEQKMNAVLLCEGLGVALRPRGRSETGVIGREETAGVVRNMMEGESGKVVKRRVNNLRSAASEALTMDGLVSRSLAQVVSHWKNIKDESK